MTQRTWLITGASAGFGRSLAEAALARGDAVAFAVRTPSKVADLVESSPGRAASFVVDMSDVDGAGAIVPEVVEAFGRLDVLVNAAGRGHVGAVEEAEPAELRSLMDLHVHGPVALIRAALPVMRAQGGGTIVNFSSQGGRMSFGGVGLYSATKFALEGLSEALAQEVEPFGVRVVIVEPGAFRTRFNEPAALLTSTPMPEYDAVSGQVSRNLAADDGRQPGDPARAARAIMSAVDSSRPPLRLVLGTDALGAVGRALRDELDEIDRWREVSASTDF